MKNSFYLKKNSNHNHQTVDLHTAEKIIKG